MTTFFTADTHFGHKRIIELATLPKRVEPDHHQMREAIDAG